MKKKDVLALAGAVKASADKYKLPGIKRSYTEKEILEKEAKKAGAKSYKDFQNAQRRKEYKYYEKRSNKAKLPKDREYFKRFFQLKKVNFKGKKAKRIISNWIMDIAQTEAQEWRMAYQSGLT